MKFFKKSAKIVKKVPLYTMIYTHTHERGHFLFTYTPILVSGVR